ISDSAFLEKNRTIEQARINSETYIKGYVNTEINRIKWNIHLPNNPTDKDKNEGMLVNMFEKIAKYKNNDK
ncbi:hypothetical protein, partial [Peribacillus loiseleuriae]|uniref:hypothetical protein n=1 Tax=Peribacillus loiseleuriae TaxID=1679170 RepID=UPI003D0055F0